MRQTASDLFAAAALGLCLVGVNDQNPNQFMCLAVAAMLAIASFKLNGK
jgi:hypothetical protein